jgi:hypothetical protein
MEIVRTGNGQLAMRGGVRACRLLPLIAGHSKAAVGTPTTNGQDDLLYSRRFFLDVMKIPTLHFE